MASITVEGVENGADVDADADGVGTGNDAYAYACDGGEMIKGKKK